MENKKEENPYERRSVNKGRRIFSEGEAGDFAYIVETGEIGIYKKIEGVEVEITTLNPGEIFGEIAVLDGRERLASAIALVDSSLIIVSQKTLEDRIAKSDKFVKTLLSIFMSNLRDTHATYKNPSFSFDGHVKSVQRNCHSLRDLVQLTHEEGFIEEASPVIKNLQDGCGALLKISQKYRDKIK